MPTSLPGPQNAISNSRKSCKLRVANVREGRSGVLLSALERNYDAYIWNTWTDNKVGELATVCLPWQHWTKALLWFNDVNISAFHSCVVVDLWQSLSEWHLLMSACVLVCRRENVEA